MRKTFAGAKLLRPTHVLLAVLAFLLWRVWRKTDETYTVAAGASKDVFDMQYLVLMGQWESEPFDNEAFGLGDAQERIRALEIANAASTVLHEEAMADIRTLDQRILPIEETQRRFRGMRFWTEAGIASVVRDVLNEQLHAARTKALG